MKIGINKIYLLFLFSFALIACEKDEDRVILQPGTPPVLSVSTNAVELTEEQADAEAITFSWTPADYGFPAAVSYTLQLAEAGTNFAEPRNVELENQLERTYTISELNSRVVQLGLEPGTEGQIEARVRATVSESVEPVFSNTVTVGVTPYSEEAQFAVLYVPGSHQGWSPGEAPRIASVNDDDRYEGYVHFPDATTEFKFTPEPNWDNDYGDAAAGMSGELVERGANLMAVGEGYYRLQADLNNLTWSATKTSWGVIGSATAGGWDADQDMTYDAQAGVWRATLNLSAGEIKFRANDAWDINLGDDGGDGSLEYNGANIQVPEAGQYEVILDLSEPGRYTYSLEQQ